MLLFPSDFTPWEMEYLWHCWFSEQDGQELIQRFFPPKQCQKCRVGPNCPVCHQYHISIRRLRKLHVHLPTQSIDEH
jgi:hypothetical protein